MACTAEWIGYTTSAAGVIGAAAAIVGLPATGVGILVEGGAIVAFIGAAGAHIYAGYQLGDCLRRGGRNAEADALEARTRRLEEEVQRLQQLVH